MQEKKLLEAYSPEKEAEVKRLWKEKGIPGKARRKNAKAKEKFYLMDGPPYATGHIHMGTALNKILKDVAIRSKRMQGFEVFDRAGYDTHGLPIEHAIEKELGFKNKQDIEAYGVENFVKKCRQFATQFIGTMNSEFEELGVWMDWENPYKTLENSYIEAIWHSFKKADEKGLLYLGKYSVHVCPRCATAVAYNEIEYAKQTDTSVYVKFPIEGEKGKFFVIWTTTPWTLPANTGIMAHPAFKYSEVSLSNGETWIVAEALVQKLMAAIEAGYTVKRTFFGKELEGKKYSNPLSKNLALKPEDTKNAYRVILSDRYVNLDEGTGLVHTAPGHGKEDFDAGSKAGLPVLSPVEIDGTMTKEAGKYAGKKARQVDPEIIDDLESLGALVYRHPYTHDYPLCWRCKTPLLMIATPQWFFRVSQIQKKMLAENDKVNWVPAWMKDRMKNWIESLGDWPVSRKRYWGSPLPIWVCAKCNKRKVVGSLAELKSLAKVPEGIDLHKPYIDAITMKCDCGNEMKRVEEVLDVWFDSGVSSWAALGFPAEKKQFERFWPADLNIEGTDQVRGWWNSQLITSTICFGKKPFESIMVHGIVLGPDKQKMAKSNLKSMIRPQEVIAKYNRDYLRYYLISASKGEDFSFDWNGFSDISRFFNILWNCHNFAKLYLEIDAEKADKIDAAQLEPEDNWILARLNSVTEETLQAYNGYAFYKALACISDFVMEDFSRTYIKLVRERVGTGTEKALARTVSKILFDLLRLLAPVTPHITEYIYQDIRTGKMPESIHLLELPKPDKKLENKALEKEMSLVKELAQACLALREENKLRLRWPLNRLVVVTKTGKELGKAKDILAKMANVKKVSEAKEKPAGKFAEKQAGETTLCLDIATTKELEDEWELRELVRQVQAMRKEANLNPNDTARLGISCDDNVFLKKFAKQIEEETNTKIAGAKGEMKKLLKRGFHLEIGQ